MSTEDSANAPLRLEWVEETTEGTTPSDPGWSGVSFNIESPWSWEPDANTTALRGSGSVKPRGFYNGAETHEASFDYSLAHWFLDTSGNAQDPAYHAMDVNADNRIKATHTVVSRRDYSTGGADNAGRRFYVVGKGGHPSSVTIPFETEEGTPILASLSYQFSKIRSYEISQPGSSQVLAVENNGTTSVDVTIEDEGAATSNTVTVAGGATELTLDPFGDIDAIELSTDVDGTVRVGTDDGSTTGGQIATELAVIKGTDSYPANEGDLGIPALGAGSRATTIDATSEVIFMGDKLDYSGTPIADEIESGELTIDLGLDDNTQTGTAERNIHATEWSAELTASVAGESVVEGQMTRYLTEQMDDVVWTTTSGETLTLVNGRLTSPGEYAPDTGEAKVMLDATFEFEDISVSNASS